MHTATYTYFIHQYIHNYKTCTSKYTYITIYIHSYLTKLSKNNTSSGMLFVKKKSKYSRLSQSLPLGNIGLLICNGISNCVEFSTWETFFYQDITFELCKVCDFAEIKHIRGYLKANTSVYNAQSGNLQNLYRLHISIFPYGILNM